MGFQARNRIVRLHFTSIYALFFVGFLAIHNFILFDGFYIHNHRPWQKRVEKSTPTLDIILM